MNNDWLQINYANGDRELHNMSNLRYLLRNKGIRKLSFYRKFRPILLDAGDTIASKTQLQVETFIGAAFVKLSLDDTRMFVPVKSLLRIKKVGAVVTVLMQEDMDEASGELTLFDDVGAEFN